MVTCFFLSIQPESSPLSSGKGSSFFLRTALMLFNEVEGVRVFLHCGNPLCPLLPTASEDVSLPPQSELGSAPAPFRASCLPFLSTREPQNLYFMALPALGQALHQSKDTAASTTDTVPAARVQNKNKTEANTTSPLINSSLASQFVQCLLYSFFSLPPWGSSFCFGLVFFFF